DWIPTADSLEYRQIALGTRFVTGAPFRSGGNQLVVTSRIAGYHAAPFVLRGVATVTIEPMRRRAVEHFCDTWMKATYSELHGDGEVVEAAAGAAARELNRAIFDPARPGLAEIASNPLLVTAIASLFLSRQHKLPASRAELYQSAVDMFISTWRQTGLNLT